jgi:hypothetical protein
MACSLRVSVVGRFWRMPEYILRKIEGKGTWMSLLCTFLLDPLLCMLWMIGKENFPSEISSANPFFFEYCQKQYDYQDDFNVLSAKKP